MAGNVVGPQPIHSDAICMKYPFPEANSIAA
jgi:hypothetical protein